MINDTIVAIATPYGKSGVGVIRLSGKDSFKLAKKMFEPLKRQTDFVPNKMILGKIKMNSFSDVGYFVFFKSPNSYTGEDVVEFQCHGGTAVTQKIVEQAILLGARLANPGEFSMRAFLNGKLTLDQAEGVIDTINAETESELIASSELLKGELTKKTKRIQNSLTEVLSEVEVNFDYPEHDIEYKTKENILTELKKVLDELTLLLKTYEQGKFIKNGINVAIVGKTNVGKSSLLNALVEEERAIVTDIEGTTRDVVIGSVEYKGLKLNFLDTAGLRKTDDKVENIGIDKAKKVIEKSDIILHLIDGSKKIDEQDKESLTLTKNKKRVVLLNKTDLSQIAEFKEEHLKVSATQKINIEEIKEKIYLLALSGKNLNEKFTLTNIRHVNVLSQAVKILKRIIPNILSLPLDCTAMDIKEVWNKLGEITGESAGEEIIDAIFSKFCLGK